MNDSEAVPGELFEAVDGNYRKVDDARYPAEGEATDYLLDTKGNEVREGDFVLVLEGRYKEKVVKVRRIDRAHLYASRSGRAGQMLPHAWSPTAGINRLDILIDGTLQSGVDPLVTEKVNLTETETARLQLGDVLRSKAYVVHQAAEINSKLIALSIEERRLRDQIEAHELAG